MPIYIAPSPHGTNLKPRHPTVAFREAINNTALTTVIITNHLGKLSIIVHMAASRIPIAANSATVLQFQVKVIARAVSGGMPDDNIYRAEERTAISRYCQRQVPVGASCSGGDRVNHGRPNAGPTCAHICQIGRADSRGSGL